MKKGDVNTSLLGISMPKETRAAFIAACKANDTNAAQVIRAFIKHYLRKAELKESIEDEEE